MSNDLSPNNNNNNKPICRTAFALYARGQKYPTTNPLCILKHPHILPKKIWSVFSRNFLSQNWLKWKYHYANRALRWKIILFNFLCYAVIFLTLLSKLRQIKQFLKKIMQRALLFQIFWTLAKEAPCPYTYVFGYRKYWKVSPLSIVSPPESKPVL